MAGRGPIFFSSLSTRLMAGMAYLCISFLFPQGGHLGGLPGLLPVRDYVKSDILPVLQRMYFAYRLSVVRPIGRTRHELDTVYIRSGIQGVCLLTPILSVRQSWEGILPGVSADAAGILLPSSG